MSEWSSFLSVRAPSNCTYVRSPMVWMRPCNKALWEVVVERNFTESLWLQDFTLSMAHVCQLIGLDAVSIAGHHRSPVLTRK